MILNLEHLPRVIPVGIQTESGVEAIGFDVSPWLTRWPDMKMTVWPTRPGESAAYIAAATEMVGNVMYWYPNTADTEKEGAGTVEVVGIGGGKRKSTGVIDTLVKKTSLDVTQETPDPFAPWYEAVIDAAEEVKEAAEKVTGGSGLFIVTVTRKPPNRVSNRTKTEILAAVEEKKTCLLIDDSNRVYTYRALRNGNPEFITTDYNNEQTDRKGITLHTAYVDDENHVMLEIMYPARTPNPYPIKLTGAVNATYDGSSAVTVEIPQGSAKAVQPDWTQNSAAAPDYVQNRTHYDLEAGSYAAGMDIPEGAASAQMMQDGAEIGWRMVKVADVTPAAADLAENADCRYAPGSASGTSGQVTAENIVGQTPAGYVVSYIARLSSGDVHLIKAAVCFEAGYVAQGALSANVKGLTATLPEPGLYVLAKDGATVTYSGLTWMDHQHTLEDRYIPSTVMRKDEMPDMPTDAHIGGLIDGKLSVFGQAVCLPEATHDNGSNLVLDDPWAVEIRAGQDYIVIHNSKTYRLTARNIPDSEVGAVLLGNGTNADLPDHNPDLPFGVLAVSNAIGAQIGAYGTVYTYDNVRPFTVAIYEASRKGYYYYDGDAARLMSVKELRQALIDAGKPVTIMEETSVTGEDGQMMLVTPLAAEPDIGVTYKVTYNGTAYDCPALGYVADGMAGVMLGNSDVMGVPGGNPDAPFVILLAPGGADIGDGLMLYGIVMDMAGAAEATLSIVEDVGGPEYMTREQVVELINEMTGGGATPADADVFYTADGQVFTTLDGAVMHVRKGEQDG